MELLDRTKQLAVHLLHTTIFHGSVYRKNLYQSAFLLNKIQQVVMNEQGIPILRERAVMRLYNRVSIYSVFFFFCSLHPIAAFAQTITVQGRVIDGKTKAPLAYASVAVTGTQNGTYTDPDGYFSISTDKNSSVRISSVGYAPQTLHVSMMIENSEILLIQEARLLAQVVVEAKKGGTRKMTFGLKKGNPPGKKYRKLLYGTQLGLQMALLIKNPEKKAGEIKNVYFAIDNFSTTKVRLRIYAVNPACGCPGTELLRENHTENVKGRVSLLKINVEKYRIPFPKNGVFLALEMIDYGPYEGKNKYLKTRKLTLLAETSGRAEEELSWGSFFDQQWRKLSLSDREIHGSKNFAFWLDALIDE